MSTEQTQAQESDHERLTRNFSELLQELRVAQALKLFRQGQRPVIVEAANRLAVLGLSCLAVAMIATVLLLVKVVAGPAVATVFTVLVAALFAALWFVLPLRIRVNGNGD